MAGQVSKLAYVDSKLGAPTNGQQTTRILYDTDVNSVPLLGRTQIDFFQSFQGKTLGQTNLQVSKLDSAESMVIKSLWFCEFLDGTDTVETFLPRTNGGTICDIIVGNQTVVKALPLQFNSSVGEPYDRLHGNNNGVAAGADERQFNSCEVRLLTNIVIPPQVDFKVVLRGNNLNSSDSGAMVCALIGYGQIFSAGTTF